MDLRHAWQKDDADFTPWLDEPDNHFLLGEAIGIEFVTTGKEEWVGPFRADITAKDLTTDKVVLIENQLDKADHKHLGQLLTYTAGKDGQIAIWIASVVHDEHRAALDLLSEITDEAIDSLAFNDRDFGRRLEEEREREIDGQFAGLFVKNLENVQGDERDVILISVGYAPGPDGRMRMNFEPINQAGGEKRLNVIFSRAKSQVGIVSSIDHGHITNDYNTGANTLTQYLRYAAAVSRGDADEMNACLEGLSNIVTNVDRQEEATDPIVEHLPQKLEMEGMAVQTGVGHSTLRIDLAARRADEDEFSRAILVDTPAHYALADVTERYVTRPAVFRAFGWQVEHVFGRDLVELD